MNNLLNIYQQFITNESLLVLELNFKKTFVIKANYKGSCQPYIFNMGHSPSYKVFIEKTHIGLSFWTVDTPSLKYATNTFGIKDFFIKKDGKDIIKYDSSEIQKEDRAKIEGISVEINDASLEIQSVYVAKPNSSDIFNRQSLSHSYTELLTYKFLEEYPDMSTYTAYLKKPNSNTSTTNTSCYIATMAY